MKFVKGEKWYEILPLLHLSQTGKHFVLLKHPTDEVFPTLVSSALIQDWLKNETWLSYAPMFSNQRWKFGLSRYGYDGLSGLHIFTPPTLSKCDSIPEFDNKFQLQLAEKQAVCEILRLTVSGNIQQKIYFLYLAQKKMLNLLHQEGYKIGFTIIDQPLILDFYKAIEPKAYLPLGSCDLNETNLLTYRGLWNIERMLKAFNHVNFRDYRRCLRENKNTAW